VGRTAAFRAAAPLGCPAIVRTATLRVSAADGLPPILSATSVFSIAALRGPALVGTSPLGATAPLRPPAIRGVAPIRPRAPVSAVTTLTGRASLCRASCLPGPIRVPSAGYWARSVRPNPSGGVPTAGRTSLASYRPAPPATMAGRLRWFRGSS
jgi:hypothetical protein